MAGSFTADISRQKIISSPRERKTERKKGRKEKNCVVAFALYVAARGVGARKGKTFNYSLNVNERHVQYRAAANYWHRGAARIRALVAVAVFLRIWTLSDTRSLVEGTHGESVTRAITGQSARNLRQVADVSAIVERRGGMSREGGKKRDEIDRYI